MTNDLQKLTLCSRSPLALIRDDHSVPAQLEAEERMLGGRAQFLADLTKAQSSAEGEERPRAPLEICG